MLWALLAFIIVGSTKYVTSVRLRALHDRMHEDHEVAEDLRRQLSQVADKRELLRSQTEILAAKVNALTNVVQNLERTLSRSSAPAASD